MEENKKVGGEQANEMIGVVGLLARSIPRKDNTSLLNGWMDGQGLSVSVLWVAERSLGEKRRKEKGDDPFFTCSNSDVQTLSWQGGGRKNEEEEENVKGRKTAASGPQGGRKRREKRNKEKGKKKRKRTRQDACRSGKLPQSGALTGGAPKNGKNLVKKTQGLAPSRPTRMRRCGWVEFLES